jgi:hypothetical protein
MTLPEPPKSNLFNRLQKPLPAILFLAVLFGVIYAQAPLYSSNQYQYFLHGMAQAGLGTLSNDWLAKTQDPTPVFSALLTFTYKAFNLPALFYIYYALLMGVYAYSLLGILDKLFHLRASPNRLLAALTMILVVHSAALRAVLLLVKGGDWAYLFDGGVAGQRVLGSVFQPSVFAVLLVLSIFLFIKDRPIWAVLAAAVAATFHPTYLLNAGVLTAIYMLVMLFEKRPFKQVVLVGLVALIAVAPILAYTYVNFGSESGEIVAKARDTLVHFRIPPHAVVAEWFNATVVIKLAFVLLALWAAYRNRRLFIVLLSGLVVAVSLTLVQVVTNNDMLALLFPWRFSILLTPISTSVLLGWLIVWLDKRPVFQSRWVAGVCYGIVILLAAAGVARMGLDFYEQSHNPDRPMETWVADNSGPKDIYAIPIKMENFRLNTLRPAYSDFESIPYGSADVVSWKERLMVEQNFYDHTTCDWVDGMVHSGHVTRIVFPKESGAPQCSRLKPIYEDDLYVIYQILPQK